jgi:hypothetical protein
LVRQHNIGQQETDVMEDGKVKGGNVPSAKEVIIDDAPS